MGMIIAVISGALMSIQGVFNTKVTDTTGVWTANAFVQFTALLVCLGAVISAFGWYEPFLEFAGAGASVPLLGFGNILMKGVKEAVDQQGLLGIFAGGFKAGAVGTCAALIFAYLASLIFNPKMKK